MCSRAMAGKLLEDVLTSTLDENGTSFMQAAQSARYAQGQDPASVLQSVKDAVAGIDTFVELHIQQGVRRVDVEQLAACSGTPGHAAHQAAILRALRFVLAAALRRRTVNACQLAATTMCACAH